MLMRADTLKQPGEKEPSAVGSAEQKQRELIKAHESRHSKDNQERTCTVASAEQRTERTGHMLMRADTPRNSLVKEAL
jgi:hypothetical protein